MKLRKGRVFASLIVAAALAASSVSCAGNTIVGSDDSVKQNDTAVYPAEKEHLHLMELLRFLRNRFRKTRLFMYLPQVTILFIIRFIRMQKPMRKMEKLIILLPFMKMSVIWWNQPMWLFLIRKLSFLKAMRCVEQTAERFCSIRRRRLQTL